MDSLKIRDLTLRDGQQSQFATRMTQKQVDRLLPLYTQTNFFAAEVWGGAVPDSVMRYLNENPWDRLEKIHQGIKSETKLTALSRGRNLFGYSPYPDKVIEGFYKNAMDSGLGIMRIFDALNDIDNMRSSINFVKKYNGIADCAVCYTIDPRFTFSQKAKAFISGEKLPSNLFGLKYYIDKAKELEKAGADIITIKDMAGLLDPHFAGELFKALKDNINIPLNIHTHSTPGYGPASLLKAILAGVDIVDVVIMNFAGGPAAPAYEIIQIFADKLGIKTGVNKEAVGKINNLLLDIRKELAEFDTIKQFPMKFNIHEDKLPKEIDTLFDQAIDFAKNGDDDKLLEMTQLIEKEMNFPAPNIAVKEAEIPGGMYTNMIAQLKQLKLEDKMEEVLKTVPEVRVASGCPPLVTPTSQIVGSQAVNCVLSKTKDLPKYEKTTKQFIDLVKGQYGHTPFPINPTFREKIAKVKEFTPYDTSNYQQQNNPVLENAGFVNLAQTEKEKLLLELFPQVAKTFLEQKRQEEHKERTKSDIREDIQPKELTQSIIENLYDKYSR